MTLEQLYALIGPDMKAVDAVIRDRLHSDVVLVRQVAEYIIASGGKRMRPALVLLAAGALGYQGVRHHEMAAVVELIDVVFAEISLPCVVTVLCSVEMFDAFAPTASPRDA